MAFLQLLLFSVFLIGVGFAAIAIKMFFKKDYVFKKQCSTIDPKTGKKMGCICSTGGACHNSSGK
jgi:hypothetical protein